MKIIKITLAIITVIPIALGMEACHSSKKSPASTALPTQVSTTIITTTTTTPSANTFLFPMPPDGIYDPGNEELIAIQAKYPQLKDVTLGQLKEGHILYTMGACIKCHTAQNIYKYEVTDWVRIIGDMALRARISDMEKDAVFKYVLAIKAAQPTGTK